MALFALYPRPTQAAEYHVDTALTREARFISRAPIEDFEGSTRQIDGYAFWKGDSVVVGGEFKGSEIYFEVPLASLRTGIDLRDRHMRENYLHTDRFPYVTYTGRIDGVERGGGDTLKVNTSGVVELHGKKKDYRIACNVLPKKGTYHVAADFEIRLPDFDIDVPSLMFMKISEIIQVKVDFHVAPIDRAP